MHPGSRCFRLTSGCWLSRRNDGALSVDTGLNQIVAHMALPFMMVSH